MPSNVGEACLEARVLDVCRDLGEDIRLVAPQVAWNDTSPVTDHVMWAVGFRSVLGLEMHEGDGREKAVDAKRGLVMRVPFSDGGCTLVQEAETPAADLGAVAYGCFTVHSREVIRGHCAIILRNLSIVRLLLGVLGHSVSTVGLADCSLR